MPPKPEIAGGGLNKYQDVSRGGPRDGSCSAGDGGRTLSPLARQVARNAVKRVSWKQTSYFGLAASMKYG
jgi:hypothetical protein